jgi:N-acetylmuramoyl-L-alanine amidase
MEDKMKTILIGRAHGKQVPGKASPATSNPKGFSDDDNLTFKEWEWSESICEMLKKSVENDKDFSGIAVELVIKPEEENEPALSVLRSRCNKTDAFALWIHTNAAGLGTNWMNARGYSVWTSRGKTKSDLYATIIYEEFDKAFPELKKFDRKDMSDGDVDYEANFNVLMFTPPSVLVETLFQDNREDVAILKSASFKDRYVFCLKCALKRIITA